MLKSIFLQNTTKGAITLNTCSYFIDSNMKTIPAWYLIGNHRISIMHACLQLMCSPLNESACRVNSLCDPNFKPTVRSLLCGNIEHSEQVNIKAFEIIQNYIAEIDQF